MERRTFLLGLIGSLAAATLAPAMAAPSQALSLSPQTPSEGAEATEAQRSAQDDLDGVITSMPNIIADAADASIAAMLGAPTDGIRGGHEGIGGAGVGIIIAVAAELTRK